VSLRWRDYPGLCLKAENPSISPSNSQRGIWWLRDQRDLHSKGSTCCYWLLRGRKSMTNLDSILESRDITADKVHIVKAIVFPSSHVWALWALAPHSPCFCCYSLDKSCSTLSKHVDCSIAWLPCPPQPPGVRSNSCPLSQWCHPTISSSVVAFSSCPQFSPATVSFPMSQHFASGGQSISLQFHQQQQSF